MRAIHLTTVFMVVAACAPSGREDDGSGSDEGERPDGSPGGFADAGGVICGEACENHCPSGTGTFLEGVVLAPNGIDPVPAASVYVPITLQSFPEGVACELCGDVINNAVVSTKTAADGSFRLGPLPTAENPVPGGTVDVVAQKGRFRRLAKVQINSWCAENAASEDSIVLPGRHEDEINTIPKIAVVTGGFDAMECVLTKLGIQADAITLFNGLPFDGGDLVLKDLNEMKKYNILFINCGANELLLDATVKANLEAYVNAGGRVYVTDQAYDFVEQVPGFASYIDFGPGASGATPEPSNDAEIGAGGITTEGLVHDPTMAAWLQAVEARTGDEIIGADSRVHIEHFLGGWAMQFAVAAVDTAKMWISGDVSGQDLSGELPLASTFDLNQCGRVLYSSYHTLGNALPLPFPLGCPADDLSPQERILEYLILHAADCIVVID